MKNKSRFEVSAMASLTHRRPENIPGDFYVDSTCIDCDTCRWMAPSIFHEVAEMSAVYHQPQNAAERLLALQALLSCPTASIGTTEKPQDIKAAHASIPIPIAENVYHCGYHAESSYGAASYFIQRPAGNILVDSPLFTPPLVARLEAMGGVRYLYLTHRDDVADHQKFHDRFGCTRVLHRADVNSGTKAVEEQLTGTEPIEWLPELQIIPVPGHSPGSTVLLYKNRFLFTGDHLAYSDRLGHLSAFKDFGYSWAEQKKSLTKLQNFQFTWVLPGHGRRLHADPPTMQASLAQCLAWMET
jgi:glyoxylase-like metal-dependent hydrolase (beta-lactamase superfamily II)/ferredoxin